MEAGNRLGNGLTIQFPDEHLDPPSAGDDEDYDDSLSDRREVKLVEDGEDELRLSHCVDSEDRGPSGAALVVDGVSRREAWLTLPHPRSGETVRGEAGVAGAGAALVLTGIGDNDGPSGSPPRRASVVSERYRRVAVWECDTPDTGYTDAFSISESGGGSAAKHRGFEWDPVFSSSTTSDTPGFNGALINSEMHTLEENLVEGILDSPDEMRDIAAEHIPHLIVDGPIRKAVREYLSDNFPRGYVALNARREMAPLPVGYIKTHRTQYLSTEHHNLIPSLPDCYRSSLFHRPSRPHLYSAYLRLPSDVHDPLAGSWSGIVRVEIPAPDVGEAAPRMDAACRTLIALAGSKLRDGRAPRNLMPTASLESHLRHRLGDEKLARRAMREAALKMPASK